MDALPTAQRRETSVPDSGNLSTPTVNQQRFDVRDALDAARKLVVGVRERNEEWAERTGTPSKKTEQDYVRLENRIAALALESWGYEPEQAVMRITEARRAS